MPLTSGVAARIPSQRLIELTNSDDTGAAAIDNAKLAVAAADVEGEFRLFANVAYDDADSRHVALAVQGVIIMLEVYKNESGSVDRQKAWRAQLRGPLRKITHNNRIKPKSSSELTPAQEQIGGEIVRPHFDTEDGFGDILPESGRTDRRPGGLFR